MGVLWERMVLPSAGDLEDCSENMPLPEVTRASQLGTQALCSHYRPQLQIFSYPQERSRVSAMFKVRAPLSSFTPRNLNSFLWKWPFRGVGGHFSLFL